MKKFAGLFLCTVIALFSVLSLSGCKNAKYYHDELKELYATVSVAETSETENLTQSSETELTETEQSKIILTEKMREALVPAELDGDYLQWAQTAADTVYRFLEEEKYYANAPDMNRFGFADLNFDSIPEIIFLDGGMWGGLITAYDLNGNILYCYNTVFGNSENYIAAVDSETGENVMLFEARGGHGFQTSHIVSAMLNADMVFREEWIYSQDGELYSYDAKAYIGADVFETNENGDELYQKYFGIYQELYRFDLEMEMIDVPGRENYTKDNVYACVSQVMKKYSENLPQN